MLGLLLFVVISVTLISVADLNNDKSVHYNEEGQVTSSDNLYQTPHSAANRALWDQRPTVVEE